MRALVLAFVSSLLLAFGAQAATISSFNRTTNDGVWSLTAAQANALGVSGATKIGAFRVRSGGSPSVTWQAGDSFNAATLTASITSGSGNVFGFFNGEATTALDYTGGFLASLGVTRFLFPSGANASYFRSVYFAFNDTVVFGGSSTFSVVNRGAFPHTITPVPVPAAMPLMLAGMGLFAAAALRRKRATAAALRA